MTIVYHDCRVITPSGKQLDFYSVRDAAKMIAKECGTGLESTYAAALTSYHEGHAVHGYVISPDGPVSRRDDRRRRQRRNYRRNLAAREALVAANIATTASVRAANPPSAHRVLASLIDLGHQIAFRIGLRKGPVTEESTNSKTRQV